MVMHITISDQYFEYPLKSFDRYQIIICDLYLIIYVYVYDYIYIYICQQCAR